MKLRRVVAVIVGMLVSGAAVFAQDTSQTPTVTLDDAINKALSQGVQAQLNALTDKSNENANAQTHAQNSLGISANGGYTHSASVVPSSGGSGSSGGSSSGSPSDTVAATLTAAIPNSGTSSPTTSVSLTGSHTIVESPSVTNSTALQLSAKQTIWNGYPGFVASGQNKIADLTLAQQKLASNASQLNLVYQVKTDYYNVGSAQATVRLDQQIVSKRKQDLDSTNTLFSAGRVSQIDVLQAQINLEQAQSNLTTAQNSLSSAQESLSTDMGLPLDSAYTVNEIQDVSVPTDSLDSLVQKAYSARSDLQQLTLTGQSLQVSKALAKASESPVVTATGQVGITHGWESNSNTGTWSAGVQVSVPVEQAGLLNLKMEQADRNLSSNGLQIQQLRRQIATTVSANFNSVVALKQSLDLAQQNLSLQQKQYQLTQVQFQQGISSNLDVLTASVNLTTAETSVLTAKTQLQLAVLKLQNSVGE